MEVKTFIFNDFYENTFVLYDTTGECIIVDAGCYSVAERETLVKFIADNKLTLKYLVNTHCHVDHVLGINYLKEYYHVDFLANTYEQYLLANVGIHGQMYGFKVDSPIIIDRHIKGGDSIKFGNSELQVLDVPGHTKGHVALLDKTDNFVITGDVLFKGSIGRTDLPGGDYDQLITSIYTQLLTLNDRTLVYPGHGHNTTIGLERNSNPFLIG